MKPTLSTQNELIQFYPTTGYSSVAPKISSTFQRNFGLGLGFNSPKNDNQKVITLSTRVTSDIQRNIQRSERAGVIVDRKGTRATPDTYTKPNQGSLSVSKTVQPPNETLSGRIVDNRGSSVPKKKDDKPSYQALSANRQLFSYQIASAGNLHDQLRREGTYSSKNRNLEVETDMENVRAQVDLKSQSTKNADIGQFSLNNSGKKGIRTQYTIEKPSRQAMTPTSQSANFMFGSMSQTEPGEERNFFSGVILKNKPETGTKTVTSTNFFGGLPANRDLSKEKGKSSEREKEKQKVVITGNRKIGFSSNGQLKYTNPNQGVIKANNFFTNNSGNSPTSISNKDRMLYQASRPETNTNNMGRPGTSEKKIFGKAQAEYSAAAKSTENKPIYEPKKANSDVERNDYASQSKDESPVKKSSLNSFVTKVNKGDFVLGKNAAQNESQPNQHAIQSYSSSEKTSTPVKTRTLALERKETSKSNKTEESQYEASNARITTIMAAQPDQAEQTPKPSKPTTPAVQKEMKEIFDAPTTPTLNKKNFVYYMSSLDKHHREYDERNYFCQIYREHFIQSYQALVFCKYMKPVDPKALASKKLSLYRRETHKDKKTLIFDMDETLIHCNESPATPSDVVLPIRFPTGEIIEAGINIRPYALEILKEMSQYYEIIVFTASHSAYANVVLDYLDPHGLYIHHRLFREHCMPTEEGVYIKDLRVIGNRNPQDMILVDNAAYSFGYQLDNGVPIIPFYDNKTDLELKHLIPYLKQLSTVKDVREINRQTFKMNQYALFNTVEDAIDNLGFQECGIECLGLESNLLCI